MILAVIMIFTSATIPAYAKSYKPNKTSVVSVTAKPEAFTVKWKKVNGVTKYQVQYAANSKFKKAKTVDVKGSKATSKTVKKLKSKKKYYIRVRTAKKKNNKYYYSSWSKCKSVTTKPTKHDHSNDTGNCGRWFNSEEELYNYWKKWVVKENDKVGGIHKRYYNGWQCSCGMWSADFLEY